MAVKRDKVIADAEKLVAKGKIEPAIKEYERLLEDNPNDVNTLNRIGDLWVRINRNDEAVKTFGKIADHYSKDGFFLKAIAIYKKINKLDPSKLDVYAKLADLYAKQGLAMEAKSQYQVLADYYLKHGDPGNALAIYRKISELDPNSINVHVKLADLYSQNNQTADALKEYDRVGRMLLKRGMLDEAVQVFKKALKIDAKNVDLVESLVNALIEAKDLNNALQIVDTALEVNRDHPRLIGLWGRIQIARGDSGSARSALEQALTSSPDEPSIRETLAELYLKQNNLDKALEMLGPVADRALARAERAAAIEILNRILRVNAKHTPTLEKLVGAYTRLSEETNILASMNTLAEAHIALGNYDQAAKVLEKLIQREPANAQHRNKLQFVKSQMGAADTMPGGKPKTSPGISMPAMEVEEPPPSFDVGEDAGLSIDFDASPPIELDMSFDAGAAAAPPPMIEPEPEPEPEVAEASDDLDFITEHLTEAEVFAKYGLAEKAAEHLRAIIERAPKHIAAHERLFRILLDEGDIDSAKAAAKLYISLLEERGENETIDVVRSEFITHGYPLDGVTPRPRPKTLERPKPKTLERPKPKTLEKPKPKTLEKPKPKTLEQPLPPPEAISLQDIGAAEEEISFDLDAAPSDFSIELEAPATAPAPAPAADEEFTFEPMAEPEPEVTPEPEPEPELEPAAEPTDTFDFGTEIQESTPEPIVEEVPSFSFAEEINEAIEEPAVEMIDEVTFDEPAAEPQFEEPVAEEEPAFFGEADPSPEALGEIDFYIEQELFDEAQAKLDALAADYPDHPEIEARRERIEEGMAAAAPPPPPSKPAAKPAAKPPTLSKAEIESELLSAIPDDEEDVIPAPPPAPPPAAVAPPPPPVGAAVEENLFADEDDFFDLAAELESELTEDEASISLSEEEQSLEEIFKEFKKGVEQQLDSEDYDTHYNLGIAYKEMGLIDEAIGEFQLASKDPKRAVECASMLGLCFLEKGMPQLAIKWYRKGVEMPEITEEEHMGLLYDLGSAYVEVGDTENAQKAFMEVYGMNTQYRDVAGRIKQLQDASR